LTDLSFAPTCEQTNNAPVKLFKHLIESRGIWEGGWGVHQKVCELRAQLPASDFSSTLAIFISVIPLAGVSK
jgi:hypothetical protein